MPAQLVAEGQFSSTNALQGYAFYCGEGALTATLTNTVITGTNCSWVITYTYSVNDACGNSLTGQTYTTSGGDHTAASLTGAKYSQVGSINTCKPTFLGAGALFNQTYALQGYADNCGGGLTATISGGGTVSLDGNDCNWTMTFIYKITDACGNVLTGQTYSQTGGNLVKPSLTGTAYSQVGSINSCKPTQGEAEGAFSSDNALLGYVDHCSGLNPLTATMTNTLVTGSNCNWTVVYTYSVTDGCNNVLTNQSYSQTGGDKTAPALSGNQYTGTTGTNACQVNAATAAPFSAANAIQGYTDNCGGTVTATLTGTAITGTDAAWTVTYTFDVSDVCGNALHNQTYSNTGRDNTPPSITCKTNQIRCATTVNQTYAAVGTEFNPASFTDLCSTPTIAYVLSGQTTGSGNTTLAGVVFNQGVTTVSWTATDAAGNTANCSFTVTINPIPVVSVSGPQDVCCSTPVQYCAANPTGSAGDGYTYQWTIAGGVITSGANSPCVTVVWNCNCTNGWLQLTKTNIATSCSYTTPQYQVTVHPLPTPVINGLISVVNGNTTTYTVANCNPAHLFSWAVTGGTIIGISNGTGICSITVQWGTCSNCTIDTGSVCVTETSMINTINQTSGCSGTSCIQVIIHGGMATLHGMITYDNAIATPLNGITVKLYDASGVLKGITTSATSVTADPINPTYVTGYYEFDNLAAGTYTLKASSTKPWAGVNATDALLIKLSVGTPSILSALQTKAGDVNLSNATNATDALLVQLRNVGLVNTFAAGDWTFGNSNANSSLTYTVTTGDNIFDIAALCTGDVNGSNVPETGAKAVQYTSLVKEGTIIANSVQEIEVPVRVNDVLTLGAVTLELSYNSSLVDVTGLTSQLAGLEYNISNGVVRIAWADVNAVNLQANDVLFTLKVRAKDAISASTNVFSYTDKTEFANATGEVVSFSGLKVSSIVADNNTNSISVYPNPFRSNAEISYNIVESGSVRITLYNAVGQRLSVLVDESKDAGTYKFNLNTSDLPSGVYSCEIIVNGKTSKYNKVVKLVKAN